ncbi:50S ribosomal protein L30 [Candidatus Hecatella orcuttiae]|jgi:large subunit ribosomal protein L30|uniref:50S ribosomal protein L30 n=1 Tax=Candidatus Hecatella orcuttiae TaxID=1935119 RepID=UPI002867BB85|nr:50S ribosomal protein L30 [Candidatus Hecatella orcuttiae]
MPAKEEAEKKCLAVVRVRGTVNVRGDVKDTLSMLHLLRPNHATLVPSTPTYLGMLKKAKDHLTWGEASPQTILHLLKKRGEIEGGRKLTEAYLKKIGFSSFKKAAEELSLGRLKLKDLKGVKPVFRLHPPSKGFKKSLKKAFAEGGELGYRGELINKLIARMI